MTIISPRIPPLTVVQDYDDMTDGMPAAHIEGDTPGVTWCGVAFTAEDYILIKTTLVPTDPGACAKCIEGHDNRRETRRAAFEKAARGEPL